MLDRSRVALRNYAEGMRFSTYPAFALAGIGGSIGGSAAGSSAAGSSAAGGPALFGTLYEAAPWQDAYSA
jgi:hypothetical protein